MENQSQALKPEWTILKLLNWTTGYFQSHNIDSPRTTAEILLAYILKLKRIDLYLRYDQPLLKKELADFKILIKRRIKREPVAYILETKEFWSLEFNVTKDVLIPRPETECLVEAAIAELSEDSEINKTTTPQSILDMGTGSGALIIAIASTRPKHLYFAVDVSQKAVKVAKENAKSNNISHRINFFCGRWFTPLNNALQKFDIIVSNPPYISTSTIKRLMPEVSVYEPKQALDGGKDGLESLRQIIYNAYKYLKPDGCLILEMGHDQKDEVKKIIIDCGHYKDILFKKDYSKYDRVVMMRNNER